MAQRELNETERREAEALKRRWLEARRRDPTLTQENLGFLLDMGQGGVSQYLLGRVPMSDWTVLRFARVLGFDPCEIRPDIHERLPIVQGSARATRVAALIERLSEADQQLVLRMVERLSSQSVSQEAGHQNGAE